MDSDTTLDQFFHVLKMTPPIIIPLKQPIAIRPEYIAQRNGTLRFLYRPFSSGFTVTDETDGLPQHLFTTSDKFWGGGRTLRETPLGPALLNMRFSDWSSRYYVLLPGQTRDTAAVQLHWKYKWSGRQECDVKVVNLAVPCGDADEMVRLRIEGQSKWNVRVNVYIGDSDAVVMTAKQVVMSWQLDWWVAIAEGFDLSLVSKLRRVVLNSRPDTHSPGGNASDVYQLCSTSTWSFLKERTMQDLALMVHAEYLEGCHGLVRRSIVIRDGLEA